MGVRLKLENVFRRLSGRDLRENQSAWDAERQQLITQRNQLIDQRDQLLNEKEKLGERLLRIATSFPPPELLVRTAASASLDNYITTGAGLIGDIRRLAALGGVSLDDCANVLDFGCGVGRAIRNLRPLRDQHLYGCDIDPESIAWCRENLSSIAEFEVVPHEACLPYEDGQFDLIYAISVFSHLDETMAFPWLRELRRVLRVGGVLVASTHTMQHLSLQIEQITEPDVYAAIVAHGTHYSGLTPTDGLPDFYGVAFHSEEYVRRAWSPQGFEIVAYEPEAIQGHQAGVVLRAVAREAE
jgi:SAM-dependent methyltransferase